MVKATREILQEKLSSKTLRSLKNSCDGKVIPGSSILLTKIIFKFNYRSKHKDLMKEFNKSEANVLKMIDSTFVVIVIFVFC